MGTRGDEGLGTLPESSKSPHQPQVSGEPILKTYNKSSTQRLAHHEFSTSKHIIIVVSNSDITIIIVRIDCRSQKGSEMIQSTHIILQT